MSSCTFYVTLGPKRPTDRQFTRQLAQSLIAQQIVAGKVLEGMFNTFKYLEGVNHDTTKDMLETRVNLTHKNGTMYLMKLIELHNARSNLCATILKETE